MFDKTSVPQPDIERWTSDDWPNVQGSLGVQMGRQTLVVEYGAGTLRGFVQVPRDDARGVIAALQAMADDLDTLDAEPEPEGA